MHEMFPAQTSRVVLPLYGDNSHNERVTLTHLFNGGEVFDLRQQKYLRAPTMAELPVGLYLLIDPQAAPVRGN